MNPSQRLENNIVSDDDSCSEISEDDQNSIDLSVDESSDAESTTTDDLTVEDLLESFKTLHLNKKLYTLKEYEQLLKQQDLHYLKKILKIINEIKNGPDECTLLDFQILNQKKINPLLRAYNNEDARRSFYLSNYLSLSRLIRRLSWRDGGIKEVHKHFPWEDLERLSDIIYKRLYNKPELQNEFISQFNQDIIELEWRFSYMLQAAQFDRSTLSEHEAALFDGIEFKTTTDTFSAGILHIRTLTEAELDIERLESLTKLFKDLATFDSNTPQGREAILATIQMLAEQSKALSLTTKGLIPTFPFEQFKLLRNKIAHMWDTSGGSEHLLELINNDSNGLISGIQKDLLSLTSDINKILKILQTRHEEILAKPSTEIWSNLPAPYNSKPYRLNLFTSDNNNNNSAADLLAIFTQSLSTAERNSNEAQTKIAVCQRLFNGELLVPTTETEIKLLLGNAKNPGTIEKLLGDGLISDNYFASLRSENRVIDNNQRKNINGWRDQAKKLLSYPQITNPKRAEQKPKYFNDFISYLTTAPAQAKNITSYEEYQLTTLFNALQNIHCYTQQIINSNNGIPSRIREACRSDQQFYMAVLFNFTIIGQCIQNLKAKPAFRTVASPKLCREFEALRWVRNSLMHNKPIDETGSLLQYFGNDSAKRPLHLDNGRIYDSDIYLQELHQEIKKTLDAIKFNNDENTFPINVFLNIDEGLNYPTALPNLAQNESPYIRELILQDLRQAVTDDDHEAARSLLDALGIDVGDEWFAPIFKAQETLRIKPSVTFKDIYQQEKYILDLCEKHGITIKGFFGEILEHGHDSKTNQSGLLVSLKENTSLANLAYFKADFTILLGKPFLIVTYDDLIEYYQQHKPITEAQCKTDAVFSDRYIFSFDRVMRGYELFEAVEDRNVDAIQQLLTRNPIIDLNILGYTALHSTCKKYALGSHVRKDFIIAEHLLRAGANPDLFDCHGKSPLHHAAKEGYVELLQLMLHYKADPNLPDENGNTPLQLAASYGQTETYQLLLPLTNLSPQEKLFAAIEIGNIALVKELLAAKQVDISEPNKNGDLPLNLACKNSHLEIVTLLLEAGANPLQLDENDRTPLHAACETKEINIELIQLLLQKGVSLDQQNTCGDTALHEAAYNSRPDVVRQLIQYGANPNIQNSNTCTPLMAILDGHRPRTATVKVLVQNGSDLALESKFVGNALHMAAERGHVEATKILLANGADPFATSKGKSYTCHGKTALQIARSHGNSEVAKLLDRAMCRQPITDEDIELAHSQFGVGSNTARQLKKRQTTATELPFFNKKSKDNDNNNNNTKQPANEFTMK